MKNFIIALFLFLLPLLATAQEVTFDTTYLSLVDGEYFVIQRVEYDNGEYEEKSRVVGDSATTATFLLNAATNEQNQLAQAAVTVIKRWQYRARYNEYDALFQSLAGGKLLWREAADQFYSNFEGNWVIRYNGEVKQVQTDKLANSNVRFRDDQNAVWLFLIFSPRYISLRQWDGQNWELYSEDGVLFTDLDRKVILRKLQQ